MSSKLSKLEATNESAILLTPYLKSGSGLYRPWSAILGDRFGRRTHQRECVPHMDQEMNVI